MPLRAARRVRFLEDAHPSGDVCVGRGPPGRESVHIGRDASAVVAPYANRPGVVTATTANPGLLNRVRIPNRKCLDQFAHGRKRRHGAENQRMEVP